MSTDQFLISDYQHHHGCAGPEFYICFWLWAGRYLSSSAGIPKLNNKLILCFVPLLINFTGQDFEQSSIRGWMNTREGVHLLLCNCALLGLHLQCSELHEGQVGNYGFVSCIVYTFQGTLWPPYSADRVELIPGNIQHHRSLPGVAWVPLHLLYPGSLPDSVRVKVGLSIVSHWFGNLVIFQSFLEDDHVTALWAWFFVLSKVDRYLKHLQR